MVALYIITKNCESSFGTVLWVETRTDLRYVLEKSLDFLEHNADRNMVINYHFGEVSGKNKEEVIRKAGGNANLVINQKRAWVNCVLEFCEKQNM